MSSQVYVYGWFALPPRVLPRWKRARLRAPDAAADDTDDEFELDLERALTAGSDATTVAQVLREAEVVDVFARMEVSGDTVRVRAVLGDDDWVQWTARLGALAEAAARLGASGQLRVEDDGAPVGGLKLEPSGCRWVAPGARRGARLDEDREGHADLLRIWGEVQGAARGAKRSSARPRGR